MQIGIGDGILSRAATNGRWIGDLVFLEMMDCLCSNLWHWGWVGLAAIGIGWDGSACVISRVLRNRSC